MILLLKNRSLHLSVPQGGQVTIKVTGGYVSKNEQDKLFKSEVERLMQEKDYSQVKAETEAENLSLRAIITIDRQDFL